MSHCVRYLMHVMNPEKTLDNYVGLSPFYSEENWRYEWLSYYSVSHSWGKAELGINPGWTFLTKKCTSFYTFCLYGVRGWRWKREDCKIHNELEGTPGGTELRESQWKRKTRDGRLNIAYASLSFLWTTDHFLQDSPFTYETGTDITFEF